MNQVGEQVKRFFEFETFRLVIETILRRATAYQWNLQGFGMLRLYLNREMRLSVWDSRFAIPNVSVIHDHPWDFDSLVVAGQLTNRVYKMVKPLQYPVGHPGHQSNTHMMSTIKCGEGACTQTYPEPVCLEEWDWHSANGIVKCGHVYRQHHDVIHSSHPLDGTVTLVGRTFREDTEHARSFWPIGTEWVSAEPRTATESEVALITENALQKWFSK